MNVRHLQHGLVLLNQQQFFAAHEVLEDVWRASPAHSKRAYQGLVQVAVAMHHISTGNLAGGHSILVKSLDNLADADRLLEGIDIAHLRQQLSDWKCALDEGAPYPAWPTVTGAVLESRFRRASCAATEAGVTEATKSQQTSQTGVPILDLRRQYETIREDVQTAIARVCESQHLVMGEEVSSFEREVAEFTGASEAVACASGTDALWLAMQAAGIGPGDAVITSPFSFFASASTIVRCGARPVFVDVEAGTLNLDPEQVSRRVKALGTGKLRAIMPVHLYGQCARMDAFDSLVDEHKLMIVEDAAQAFGAAWRDKRAGSLGRAAGFSFYPTKNLSAFGDGGCVTTSDAELAARMRRLRNHGSDRRYYHEEIGWNSRLDTLQAAVLRVKMKHIDQWNRRRREVADLYDKLFEKAGLSHGRPLPGEVPISDSSAPVRMLSTAPEAYHIFHQYVVLVPRRDELRQFLAERKIGTEVYYPVPLHLQKCFSYLGYGEGDLPIAERAANEVLALPIFPELTEDEQRAVVNGIAEFYS